MQLSRLLKDRHFWSGFGAGGLAVILCIVSVSTVWIVRTKHRVEQRLDEQWAELEARTRPLLDPPAIPAGRAIAEPPGTSREVVDLTDWRLKTLEGRTIRSGQLTGHPLFINFWATWCSPCVAELPAIQDLAASTEAKSLHLQVLLVTDEDPGAVQRFLARRPDLKGLPVALAHDGIPAAIWFRARPETSILGCHGDIILRQTGPADWSAPAFRRYLEAVLGRSCGT